MFRELFLAWLLALSAAAQTAPAVVQSKFRISGTTTDSVRGNTLSGIEVSLNQKGRMLQTATTDSRGRFEFAALDPGKYGLTGVGAGYLEQDYEQHGHFSTGIVVGPGIESGNLVFRLKRESSISGMVKDEFNEPVSSAEVYLFLFGAAPRAMLLQGKYTTSDSGTYYFGRLHEGSYYLVVSAHPWYARNQAEINQLDTIDAEPGEQEQKSRSTSDLHGHSQLDVAFPTTYYVNATEPGEAAPIDLKPGENATADFHLTAVSAVQLTVRGVPAFENTSVPLKLSEKIFGVSRLVTTRLIDQDGTVLKGLAPGHYVLEYPPQGDSQPEQQPLDLLTDKEIGPDESAGLASSVSGTVQLGSEGLCLRCKVGLINLPSYQMYLAQPNPNGFRFDRSVRPGRYVVLVFGHESYYLKAINALGAHVEGTDLEIPPGADVRLTIVTTKDLGTVSGFALRDGKPASAVAVDLIPDDPTHHTVLFRNDQSDSDGSFEVSIVVPGWYTVFAIAEGWDLDPTSPDTYEPYLAGGVRVQVRAGEKQQIKVNVQAKRGISR